MRRDPMLGRRGEAVKRKQNSQCEPHAKRQCRHRSQSMLAKRRRGSVNDHCYGQLSASHGHCALFVRSGTSNRAGVTYQPDRISAASC